MQEQEIVHYLRLLGEELAALRLRRPVRLLMVGGAYMITQIGNRANTMDVDVFVRIDPESEDYRQFQNAVRFIASDMHLRATWLNNLVGEILESTGKVPTGNCWLKHGMLEIYTPDPGYILVLKLLAGREKDLADIEALLHHLGITKRKQVETFLKKYVSKSTLEEHREELHDLLDDFFQG